MRGWIKTEEARLFFKCIPKLVKAVNKLTAAVDAQNAMARRAGANVEVVKEEPKKEEGE